MTIRGNPRKPMVMDYRTQLLTLCSAYAARTGLSEARIATLVANDGKFFRGIRGERSCTVDTYLKVQGWFGANWPADLAWPDGCDRPGVLPVARIEASDSEQAA